MATGAGVHGMQWSTLTGRPAADSVPARCSRTRRAQRRNRLQAAEEGPSTALPRSRGAATYEPSTPRASDRVAPC